MKKSMPEAREQPPPAAPPPTAANPYRPEIFEMEIHPPTWGPENGARADYQRVIAHEGAMIYFRRANASLAVKNYRRAVGDYTRALEYSSKTPEIYYNRALSLSRLGYTKQAIGDYTAALKIDAGYAKAYCNRAALYWKVGRTHKALHDMKMAAALGLKEMQAFLRSHGVTF